MTWASGFLKAPQGILVYDRSWSYTRPAAFCGFLGSSDLEVWESLPKSKCCLQTRSLALARVTVTLNFLKCPKVLRGEFPILTGTSRDLTPRGPCPLRLSSSVHHNYSFLPRARISTPICLQTKKKFFLTIIKDKILKII